MGGVKTTSFKGIPIPRVNLRLGQRLRRARLRASPAGREIIRLHDELEGLLSFVESQFLYNVGRGAREIVEIGSYRGKSCVLMALGSRVDASGGAHITAIDPHGAEGHVRWSDADHEAFNETLHREGVADQVTHLRMRSNDAADQWTGGEVDVLWIDGDHTYQGARDDFERWHAQVRVGGVIAAHDAFSRLHPEVYPAWRDVIEASGLFEPTRRCRSIAYARRVE